MFVVFFSFFSSISLRERLMVFTSDMVKVSGQNRVNLGVEVYDGFF